MWGARRGVTRSSSPLLFVVALAACTDPAPPVHLAPPRVARFTVEPFAVRPGEEVTLRWSVEGATELVLDGPGVHGPVAAEGARTTTVAADATFTLDATGPGGHTRAEAAVLARAPDTVAITRFDVAPRDARPLEDVTLTWGTAHATRVALTFGDGRPVLLDPPASGRFTVRAARDFSVELRAEGPGGPAVRTIAVRVAYDAPRILSFAASPAITTVDGQASVGWEVEAANRLVLEEDLDSGVHTTLLDTAGASTTGSFVLDVRSGSRTLVLRAFGDGGAISESTRLVVRPRRLPTIARFTATPTTTGRRGDVVVRWEALDADHVELVGGPLPSPSFLPPLGAFVFQPLASGDLTLTARGGTAASAASATLSLTVDPARPELDAILDPAQAGVGEAVHVDWTATAATRVRLETERGALLATSTAASGRFELVPPGSTTLVLRAINAQGATERLLPVRVSPRPRVTSLEVSSPRARIGRTLEIRWTTEDALFGELLVGPDVVPLTDAELGAGARTVIVPPLSGELEIALHAANTLFGATATIAVELLPPATSGEAEPNDDAATANTALGGTTFAIDGELGAGDVDVYAFIVPPSSHLGSIATEPPLGCLGELELEVFEVTPDLRIEGPIASSAPVGACPAVSARGTPALALAARSFLAVLRPTGDTPSTLYRLQIARVGDQCGDGIVERDEECDDGNTAYGDGCTPDCVAEGLDEREPAQGLAPLAVGLPGLGLLTPEDDDRWRITVGPGEEGPFELVLESPGPGECALDAVLELYDDVHRLVARSQEAPPECPRLTGPGMVLGAGSYLLAVRPGQRGPSALAHGRYRLDLEAR